MNSVINWMIGIVACCFVGMVICICGLLTIDIEVAQRVLKVALLIPLTGIVISFIGATVCTVVGLVRP